jgi:uncharacterized membrane-anchored protein YhcB (DUF1043 family)
MKITKDRVLFGVIIVLILWIVWGDIQSKAEQKRLYEKLQEQNKMIVDMDVTTKEKDGQYAKLVNYFEDQKSLLGSLKEDNRELYDQIKGQDEKILMLNKTIISLEEKINEGEITENPEDSTVFDLALTYPNSDESFINWNGSIFTKTKTYKGKWSFGELPLQVVMTETERGLWKSRLIGPEWLLVDSIEVKSLPPQEFSNEPELRPWSLFLGGGYIRSFDPNLSNALSFGTGVKFKSHSLFLNGTTNKTIGFNYYYQFTSFKKE